MQPTSSPCRRLTSAATHAVPYRVAALLKDALEVYGDREAAVANDLTKLFEKVERGPISALLESPLVQKPKGEYIVVIAGVERKPRPGRADADTETDDDDDE